MHYLDTNMTHAAIAVFVALLSASTYVSGQECPGSLTGGTDGWLTSPNHPRDYDNNEDCTWTIRVEDGHAIRIEINLFWTEKDYDVIKIFETTPSGVRRQTESYSGANRPPVYTSRTNRVDITFVSDESGVGEGFNATWNKVDIKCGFTESSATRGAVTSPHYPNPYDNDSVCYWTILVDSGHFIRLTFHSPFALQSYYLDYIKIFEISPQGDGLVTKSYSGSQTPPVYTSVTNEVEIQFTSDKSEARRGFNVSWERIGENQPGRERVNTGNKAGDCTWFFEVPLGSFIKFTFNPPFQMDWDTDLRLFQMNADGVHLLEKYLYGDRAPPTYTSMSNRMGLAYDGKITGGRFNMTWEKMDTRCGNILSGTKGVIKAGPSDPQYNDYTNCQWLIEGPKEYIIRLVFDPPFLYDPFNQSVVSISPLGEEVGTPSEDDPLSTYLSKTNRVEILHYNPAGIGTGQGFGVTWTAFDTRCGGVLNGTSGSIVSPNYPYFYPDHTDCTWTIDVSDGKFIRLTFQTPFEMQSKTDVIEISEKSLSGESRVRARYDTNTLPPVYTSTTNRVEVTFNSFRNLAKNAGFHLAWQEVDETSCGQVVEVVKTISAHYSSTMYTDDQCLPRHTRQRRCSLTFRARPDSQEKTYPLCTTDSLYIDCRSNSTARITVSNSTNSIETMCGESLDHKFCAPENEDLHVTYEGNGLCPTDMIDNIAGVLDVYQEKYKPKPRTPVEPVDDDDSSFHDWMYALIVFGSLALILGIVYGVMKWRGRS